MTRRYMTKKGKHIPLRGGQVTLKRVDREMGSGSPAIKDKAVLPAKGSLFGSDKLGNFGGVQGGKPIVQGTKKRRGESGFGL
jgi:hypothetical protein